MSFVPTDLVRDIMNAEFVFDCKNEACVDEIDKLEAEIASCMRNYHLTKQKYNSALVENLKKDFILHNLTNQLIENRFDEFCDMFSIETVKLLRKIGPKPENDSSFVLTAVRGLYRNNLATLKNKSYSGISKNKTKEPLTPEKVTCLRSIYEKRIEYVENETNMYDVTERKTKFSKHVKTALESINKSN